VIAAFHAREIEMAARAEARFLEAKEKTAQAEEKTAQAEEKTAQAEEKTAQAEEKTNQVENYLAEVLNSSSWRYTQPLRQLSSYLKQSNSVNVVLLLSHLRLWLQRRPRLRLAVRRVFSYLPHTLRYRLNLAFEGAKIEAARSDFRIAAQQPSDLAVRVVHIYNELKQTIDAGSH
jgi:hypothetical protein